jgi:large conductance mechanosensitive channel
MAQRVGDQMLKEFKDFAMRGNVVDLAIGVIIGAAFGKIVDSLVNDVIMPLVGAISGGLDFSNYFFVLKKVETVPGTYVKAKELGATLGYGQFVTVTINFMIIAFILFLVVKGLNRMKKAEAAAPAAPAAPPRSEVLLEEIRDLLKTR